MTKWEYKFIDVPTSAGDLEKMQATANELGAEGWEIIDCDPIGGEWMRMMFKRPIHSSHPMIGVG